MRSTLVLFAVLIMFGDFSCKAKEIKDKKWLRELSLRVSHTIIQTPPSGVVRLSVFFLYKDTCVIKETFANLYQLYKNCNSFHKESFDDFIIKLTDSAFIIDSCNQEFFLKDRCPLNKTISKYYNGSAPLYGLNKFLVNNNDSTLSLKDKQMLDEAQLQTISYILFINGYIRIYNEYTNETYFKRVKF